MKPTTKYRIIRILRWVARIMGGLLFSFFVWFAFNIGGPDFDLMTNQEILLFGANMVMLIGLVLVWRLEFIGSIFLIGGFISFSIINNSFWIGPIFPMFLIIGLLHLGCWISSFYPHLGGKTNPFKYFLY
ncbi:MAG: hypothetical protein ACEPOZ_21825 [Marinifilaceae bacterium]